jgi:transcription antitermination factor NusG
MASPNANPTCSADYSELPASYCTPFWYAAYTSANHEKRVAIQLTRKSVEHFLPLYDSVRLWKDRRRKLQLPLFPGYVFVKLALRDRLQVLQVPGVAKFVGFNGTPAQLPQKEMEALRASLVGGAQVVPHPYLKIGQRVRVREGSLAGIEGILTRKKNGMRFVLSLDLIMRSVAVEIDVAELEPVW